MKKRHLPFLFFALFAHFPISAQQQQNDVHQKLKNYHKQLIEQLASAASSFNFKANGLTQRLIAQTSSDFYSGIDDSTNYTYAGNRGSTFDFNAMIYRSITDYGPFYTSSDLFLPTPLILCEHETGKRYNGNGYTPQYTAINTYTPGGLVSNKQKVDLFSLDTFTTYYSYNAQNNPDLVKSNYSSSYSLPDSTIIYYSTAGQRIHDTLYSDMNSIGNNQPYTAANYVYDSNGNLIYVTTYARYNMATWEKISDITVDYTNTNQVKTISWNYTAWGDTSYQRDSFGYNNAVAFYTYRFQYGREQNHNNDDFSYETIKHLNAQLLPDTVSVHVVNLDSAITPYTKLFVFTYNSYGNPVQSRTYNDLFTLTNQQSYYYEDYNPASVQAYRNTQNFRIFPNPAKDMILLQAEANNTTLQPSTIHLMNAMGQTILSRHTNWQNNTEQLNIGNLPGGTYWISIMNDKGSVLYRQAIVKQ